MAQSNEGVYVFDSNARNGVGDLVTAATLMGQNGGFGGMNPLWMMFMYPFILPFINGMYGGFGGFGGYGGGAGNILGTGFLSNQLNNNSDKETILNALQYNREAISQLANQFGTSVSDVQNNIAIANSKLADIGAQLGMTGMQVINAIQNGDAALGRQLCECCCNMRYDLAQQTNALQSQAANNFAASQLQAANNQAATQLQMAQIESADQLAVCLQTNQLGSQADKNTNSILGAIQNQNAMLEQRFCEIKERELQGKIDTQSDIITQLKNQISNDHQTLQFNAAFHALDDKIDAIAAKQPATTPVIYPNLTAVNSTPYAGGFGWGNGFGGGIVF
jgi:hypothetical protein